MLRSAAFDAEQAALVPGFLRRLAPRALGLRRIVVPQIRRAAVAALADQGVDLAIGCFWDIGLQVLAQPLYRQGFAVTGRPEVPGPEAEIPMARHLALPHVLVAPDGDLTGVADAAQTATGQARRVVTTVPQSFPCWRRWPRPAAS